MSELGAELHVTLLAAHTTEMGGASFAALSVMTVEQKEGRERNKSRKMDNQSWCNFFIFYPLPIHSSSTLDPRLTSTRSGHTVSARTCSKQTAIVVH